ncbi:MAG: DUF4286 family protein [Capnocytophaga sp.]|nr:DUF4286 family protein [Capnocytophaga sp.]
MKYIYNITYHIENSVFVQWQKWIISHIEQLLSEGYFEEAKLLKIHAEYSDSQIYSIQFSTFEEENISRFEANFEAKSRHLLFLQFGEKVLPFATKIEIIEEFEKLK